jgi:ABC-type lipoprotein export system ATPase subunit
MKNDNSLSLNQGQEEATNAVFQFLFSADNEFSVSGPAGTGKTTLMKHIFDHTL